MSGNGPLFQYATLREYLPAKKVKRILWMYYEGNDFGNMHMELQNEILTGYLKDKNLFLYRVDKGRSVNEYS